MSPHRSSILVVIFALLAAAMFGCEQMPPITNVTIEAPEEQAPVQEEEPSSDLLIGATVGWYGVEEGGSLEAPFIVTNQSDHDVTYSVEVFANPGEDFILFSDPQRTLTPGSEALVIVRFDAPEDITSEMGYEGREAFITLTTESGESHELWLHVDVWDADAFYGGQELAVWTTELWMNTDAGREALGTIQVQGIVETDYEAVFSDEHDSGFVVAENAQGTLSPGDSLLVIVEFQAPDALVEGAFQVFWNILTIATPSGEVHQVLVRAEVYDPAWTPPAEE